MKAPTEAKITMNPIRIVYGTRKSQMNSGMRKMFMISRSRFPMNLLEMRPQTRSALFWKRSGPGRIPHIMKPASMTAVVGEPGTPRARSGAKPLIEAALFAASGEAIPSMIPVPNFSGCLETRFSAR